MRFRDGLTVRRIIQVLNAEQRLLVFAIPIDSFRDRLGMHCTASCTGFVSRLCVCVLLLTKAWTTKRELVRHVTDCLEES